MLDHESFLILCINPGSTSTKIGVYRNSKLVCEENIQHDPSDLKDFSRVAQQKEYRTSHVKQFLENYGIALTDISAVVGRGGMMKPIPGGTYKVNDAMLEDLAEYSLSYYGSEHISNLGAALASSLASEANAIPFIIDPISTDDFTPDSRLSGVPEIERVSLMHSLNLRAKARKAALHFGTTFEETNMVGCHLGGGISMCAFKRGKAIDANHGLLGYGPFSPQRAGTLPISSVMEMCFSGEYTPAQLRKKFGKQSGFIGYFGTDDGRAVLKMIDEGDELAITVFEAMATQIAKELAGLAAVLSGDICCIFITGGLANAKKLTKLIENRIQFMAPVLIVPGEDELEAMCEGALRILRGEETPKEYDSKDSLKARISNPEEFKILRKLKRS